jgi:hypothetical protein
MWRRQRRVNGVGIVYRHGKSGSGVGCACGLIKLIITSVHPNISTRQLHSVSSHLLYVILSSRRPMRGSMLCQLFECYSCSFVRAPSSVSLPVRKILEKIHLFSPPGRLFLLSPRRNPTLYATKILMTAAVFCHSQVDPWAFHRLAERDGAAPIQTRTRRGSLRRGRGGCAAIDLPICTYNIVGHQKRKRKEVEEE